MPGSELLDPGSQKFDSVVSTGLMPQSKVQ